MPSRNITFNDDTYSEVLDFNREQASLAQRDAEEKGEKVITWNFSRAVNRLLKEGFAATLLREENENLKQELAKRDKEIEKLRKRRK